MMLPLVQRRPRGQPSRLQPYHLPAPIGGVNTIASGVDIPKTDAIYCYNMIGGELGLRTRLGWREWVTNIATGGVNEQVRTLIPYTGSTKNGASNRLFACTTSGIWDVSSSTNAPTQVVTFGTQNTDSGFGISTVFVTAAGHFLCYCDEANGYYVYTESTTTWTASGPAGSPVTGADPTKLVFVCPWKNRLWFVEKDTGRGWYLPVNAIGGAATAFTFGARFKAGGDLRGLWSWTFDGGSGIDDRLVAVSGGGDVLIYSGTDPASASTFGLVGVWFVGSVPVGRNLCTDFGGDLLVMSSIGILPLSKLVTGNIIYDRSQYQTFKIGNLFNQMQASTSTLRGWSMQLHPQDASLLVLVPTATNQPTQQLVMSLITRGWSVYRDMPVGVCAVPWGGSLYFGTEDGRVCINDGYVDGVTLAAPGSYSTISWSLLSGFSNLGVPYQKQVQFVRARILSQGGGINYQAKALYGWNMTEPTPPTGTATASGSVWDVGLWDTAVWGGAYNSQNKTFGSAGMASEVALAIRGTSSSRTVLTGFDCEYESGGFL